MQRSATAWHREGRGDGGRPEGRNLAGADEDYFADMDYGYRRASDPSVKLNVNEVRGRNNWNVWTAGNDRFWDYMANHTLWGIRSPEGSLVLSADRILHRGLQRPARQQISDARRTNPAPADFGASAADAEACKKEGKTWVPISRDVRWRYYGLVNEPCFEKAKGPDEYGLWLDKRVPASADARPIHSRTKPNIPA